jgi:NAD(P)-dependent dehydrogenase (short-subunit alcohol dehydrogenase family)
VTFSLDSVARQDGRIAVVTGANAGLGYETTKAFAAKGMKVVMACRTESRALDSKARIEEEIPDADLLFMKLDLSDLASVRAFAAAFRETFDSLDVLVLNAGIMMPPYTQTVDGFESQMAANVLGHFLLTSLLLDRMPDSPASRVVSLSSNVHKGGQQRIVFEDLHWEQAYVPMDAYAQSKLACLMFGNALNRRLAEAGLSTVSVSAHPGMSTTDLDSHARTWILSILRALLAPLLAHPPDKGALPQIRAALDPEVQGGQYYGPTGFRQFKGPPGLVDQLPYALDEGHQDQLWQVAKEATGAMFPWEA